MKVMQNVKIVPVIKPGAIVDNDDFPGAYNDAAPVSIDTLGWNHLDVYVMLGETDIAIAEMSLYESDTADGTFTKISASDYNTQASLPAADDDNKVFAWHVSLGGERKRYIQINLKAGDGATGTYAVAFAVLSQANQTPNSAAERGLKAELFV